jgi:hypothetical protein
VDWLASAMLGVPEKTPKKCVRTSIAFIKAMGSGITDDVAAFGPPFLFGCMSEVHFGCMSEVHLGHRPTFRVSRVFGQTRTIYVQPEIRLPRRKSRVLDTACRVPGAAC